MEKVLFKTEEQKTRQEIAVFLRNLADRIEQGRLVLRQGSEEVSMDLPERITLENKLEEEIKGPRTKMSFEVELEWPKEAEQSSDTGIELG